MSEVSSIQKVSLDLPNIPVGESASQANLRPAVAQVPATRSREVAPQEKGQSHDPAPPEAQKVRLPIKEITDIQLRYQVNSETNEITVLLIDKTSHKVIRTIPSDELKNFKEGDLFELTY